MLPALTNSNDAIETRATKTNEKTLPIAVALLCFSIAIKSIECL